MKVLKGKFEKVFPQGQKVFTSKNVKVQQQQNVTSVRTR